MLASPAGSKVVRRRFERLAHFVPIAAIVIQTATTRRTIFLTHRETCSRPLAMAYPDSPAQGRYPTALRLGPSSRDDELDQKRTLAPGSLR
jgi:hypothetical protein